MVTAPVSSNVLFSSSFSSIQINQFAYAEEEGDSDSSDGGGESDSSDGGGESDSGDQSTSSTTTDPALASSTTTDPTLAQSPLGLTFSTTNAPAPLLVEDTEEQDLDCDDVSDRNFEVSSNDPNGFDGDNDGIGCESNDEESNENSSPSPISVTSEGPDNDCLFNPDLPKCASNEGDCPDGFFNNDDDQCVPEGGCPDGYHTVDDDETGKCIPDSDGCPEGMIFRSDGKTCGSIEIICEDSPELEQCADTSCDPSYPDFCISPNQRGLNCDNHDGKVEPNEIFKYNFKVNQPDTQDFDRDGNGIGCEYNGGNDGNDNDGNDNDGNDNDHNYIIKASNSCADISDTVDLSSEQLDSEEVRTIAFFGNCELDSASLQLNLVQNDNLKLVAANLDNGLSDAVEVEMNQIGQSDSSSNVLYKATITNNQEGNDLDTDEIKTLNNVNGIVLWNNDEDEPIELGNNNFVEANINFLN